MNTNPLRDAAARRSFAYLAATDPRPAAPVDAIIGFGMFDLTLPVFCGGLFHLGLAPRIIFTGGIGAGTGDLGGPEAEAWRAALLAAHPDFPVAALITESRSTNTAENIAFTAALLAREHPALAFGRGLASALVVASPARLRRVGLTLRRLQPAVRIVRALPPETSFEHETEIHAAQGIDFTAHLCGELDRIVDYPRRDWIESEPLPPEIAAAHAVLKATGGA